MCGRWRLLAPGADLQQCFISIGRADELKSVRQPVGRDASVDRDRRRPKAAPGPQQCGVTGRAQPRRSWAGRHGHQQRIEVDELVLESALEQAANALRLQVVRSGNDVGQDVAARAHLRLRGDTSGVECATLRQTDERVHGPDQAELFWQHDVLNHGARRAQPLGGSLDCFEHDGLGALGEKVADDPDVVATAGPYPGPDQGSARRASSDRRGPRHP
jgi:hypothetical protein